VGTTSNYGIPYPQPSAKPNLAVDFQAIVAKIDSAIMSIPIGASFEWDYGSAQIPSWVILQYGQAVSRTTYPALHNLAVAAFYPHGSGDNSTTFNIADKRGRASAGKDDMGGAAANRITAAISGTAGTTLGAAVGVEGVTLATASMPSHSHGGATGGISADHSHSGTSAGRDTAHNHSDPGHNHSPAIGGIPSRGGWMGDADGYYSSAGGDPMGCYYGGSQGWCYANTGNMQCGGESADHYHGNTTGGIDTNHVHGIYADGGGGAHLNTQPTIIAHKVVRAI